MKYADAIFAGLSVRSSIECTREIIVKQRDLLRPQIVDSEHKSTNDRFGSETRLWLVWRHDSKIQTEAFLENMQEDLNWMHYIGQINCVKQEFQKEMRLPLGCVSA